MHGAPQLLISELFLAKKKWSWGGDLAECFECTYPKSAHSPGKHPREWRCGGGRAAFVLWEECGSVPGPTCHAGVLHSSGDSAPDFLLRRKPENTCYCWQLVPQQQTDRRTDQGSCIPAYRTRRLVKSCLGIKKWCLKEKMSYVFWV